jgi:uncharacterized protein YraI
MTRNRRWLGFALLCGIALALVPSFARGSLRLVLAQPPAPTIQVLDGSTVVQNTAGTLGMPNEFPPTNIGTPVSKDFTVNNIGTADLFLNDLILPAGFTGEFVGSGTNASVPPSGSVTLRVTCTAAVEGTFAGNVAFNTNDLPDNNPFTFTISCNVTGSTPAQISANVDGTPITNGQTSPIVLPNTFVNQPSSRIVTITNTGELPLNITNISVGGVFSANIAGNNNAIIQPNSSATLTINCLSTLTGTFDGVLFFNSNDPTATIFSFPVRCTVNAVVNQPEIDVSFGGVGITNNQANVVALGTTGIDTALTRTIDLRNTGALALNLSDLTIVSQPPLQVSAFFGTTPNTFATTINPAASTVLTINCFSQAAGAFTALVQFTTNDPDENPYRFTVRCNFEFQTPTPTLSATPTLTQTATRTGTRTPFPTVVLPTSFLTAFSPTPSLIPTFTPFPTFVFTPFQRTPAPAPACARQSPPIAPTGVVVLANRDAVNVRTVPAIGAPVIGFVNAGYTAEAQARSGDSQWVRVQFAPGQQGWIGLAVLTVLNGAIEALPVADPRSIPYGGFETPRAGLTGATSPVTGRLAQSGLRVRSGPSTNYVVLANAPRYSVMAVLGRSADNRWVQVNFEGTLGWAAAEYFEFSSPDVFALPVDGICADAVPIAEGGDGGFFDVLRFLRDRLDLAQPSLDAIRAIWTNVALGGVAQCGNYPIRPTDYNIPQPLLAAYNDRLAPLERDFNAAMGAIRLAVEQLIEACGFAQPSAGSVGQAAVQQALDAVNRADALFADIRRRIAELLPPDELGADECLFLYTGQAAVVKRLEVGQPRNAQLTSRPAKYVVGFCFDAPAGQDYRVEILRLSGSAAPRLTVSNFDNPTNFIAQTDLGGNEQYTALQPITITQNGRYLLLVSDLDLASAATQGDFVVLLTNVTGVTFSAPSLSIDPVTGQIVVNPVPSPLFPTQQATQGGQATGVCPNITFTCEQLLSCDQAQACYLVGNTSLDGDQDGIPCENLCQGINVQPTFDIN